MASATQTARASSFDQRLDDIQISEPDRRRAKQLLRQAEAFAEAVVKVEAFARSACVRIQQIAQSFAQQIESQ